MSSDWDGERCGGCGAVLCGHCLGDGMLWHEEEGAFVPCPICEGRHDCDEEADRA